MGRIAFQGELGAYGHEACVAARPEMEPLPCATFEDCLAATREGRAEMAMIAVENSTYGRVADVHRLLPESGLRIVGEHFVRVRIALMARPGTALADVRRVRAHLVLLPQCAGFLRENGIEPVAAADSAGAARQLAGGTRGPEEGVLASALAAEIYGLDVLARDIEDHGHNTTRFVTMAREAASPPPGGAVKTTFVFRVRNIPAALYKAMGGFATNGVNMTKLESYMIDGAFTATQFYADVEGHPDDPALARALEELDYFTDRLEVLGVYPADPEHFDGGH